MVWRRRGVRGQRPAGPGGRRGVGCPRAGRAPAPSPASAPPRRGRRRPAARRDPRPRLSAALVPLPGDLRPVLQLSGPRRPRALSGSSGAGVPSAGALTAVLGVRRAAVGSGIGRSPVRPGGARFPDCPASAPRDGLPGRGFAQPAPVHPGALPKPLLPLLPLLPLPPLPLALLPLRHAGDREPTTERVVPALRDCRGTRAPAAVDTGQLGSGQRSSSHLNSAPSGPPPAVLAFCLQLSLLGDGSRGC